jgi:hypothetical protein
MKLLITVPNVEEPVGIIIRKDDLLICRQYSSCRRVSLSIPMAIGMERD